MELIRLDKLICDAMLLTRKQARQLIKSGRVLVDGRAMTDCDGKVDAVSSTVSVDGKSLSYRKYHYYLMDKPAGILTATEDKKQPTVLDLLPHEIRHLGVSPVGRLDKDTTGLLIITDDGDFAHRVISPRSGVKKTYIAEVDGIPDREDVEAFRTGIVLGDGTQCLPAELELLGGNRCRVTVMEGKYHQVKRMLASRGKPVTALRRISVGGLSLEGESIAPGEFRELAQNELCIVMKEK